MYVTSNRLRDGTLVVVTGKTYTARRHDNGAVPLLTEIRCTRELSDYCYHHHHRQRRHRRRRYYSDAVSATRIRNNRPYFTRLRVIIIITVTLSQLL